MKKFDAYLTKAIAASSGLCFILVIGLVVANVFCRFFLGTSLVWSEETAYLFLNWAVFLGVCLLYRKNGLVAIDVLVNSLPIVAKKIANLIAYAMLTVINAGLVKWSYDLSMEALTGGRSSTMLKIPYFYYYIAVTVASVILTGYSIMFIFKVLKNESIDEDMDEEKDLVDPA